MASCIPVSERRPSLFLDSSPNPFLDPFPNPSLENRADSRGSRMEIRSRMEMHSRMGIRNRRETRNRMGIHSRIRLPTVPQPLRRLTLQALLQEGHQKKTLLVRGAESNIYRGALVIRWVVVRVRVSFTWFLWV